jgi:hypothetical protein
LSLALAVARPPDAEELGIERISDLAGGAMSIEGVRSPIQHRPVLEYEAIPCGRIAGRTPLRKLQVCRVRDAHD